MNQCEKTCWLHCIPITLRGMNHIPHIWNCGSASKRLQPSWTCRAKKSTWGEEANGFQNCVVVTFAWPKIKWHCAFFHCATHIQNVWQHGDWKHYHVAGIFRKQSTSGAKKSIQGEEVGWLFLELCGSNFFVHHHEVHFVAMWTKNQCKKVHWHHYTPIILCGLHFVPPHTWHPKLWWHIKKVVSIMNLQGQKWMWGEEANGFQHCVVVPFCMAKNKE